MRCRVGAVVRAGTAVTVHDATPSLVHRAVGATGPVGEAPEVAVDCPEPGPLVERVGPVDGAGPETRRGLLAAVARSRGLASDHDEALARARERLAELCVEDVEGEAQRRAVAETSATTERLRERVAAARERLAAAREGDGDVAAASEALSEAVTELTEAETTAAAAAERLATVRERRRAVRDRLERRRRLEDRVANLERRVRAELAGAVEAEVRAVERELREGTAEEDADEEVLAALAAVAVGEPAAPVVLDAGAVAPYVDGAGAAASRLDAPVVYVR